MSWRDIFKKEIPQEQELDRLRNNIATRIYTKANFQNMAVDFEFPEHFIQLTNEFCTGHIEWRKYRADAGKGKLSADNRWKAHSSIFTHRHDDSDEVITSIHGEGYCTIYDDFGHVTEKILIAENESYTIKAGVNHFVECDDEWDMIVSFNRV